MSLQLRALLRGFHLRFSRKKIRRVGGVGGVHALLLLFRAYKNPYRRKCPKHLSSLCGRDSNTSSALPLIFIFFSYSFAVSRSPLPFLPTTISLPPTVTNTNFFSLPILEIKFPSQLPGRAGNGKRTQQGCDNVNRKTSHSRSLPPALCHTALSCLTLSHLRNLKQLKTM